LEYIRRAQKVSKAPFVAWTTGWDAVRVIALFAGGKHVDLFRTEVETTNGSNLDWLDLGPRPPPAASTSPGKFFPGETKSGVRKPSVLHVRVE